MRKHTREQLVALFDTINDALKQVKRMKSAEEAHNLLVDCYQTAQSAGQTIQEHLSPERGEVYACRVEDLLGAMETANEALGGAGPLSKAVNAARDALKRLQYELKRESEITYELLFLPYKASMWDCMESIWEAAEKDPRCDCYVVPIPYYSKNTGGTLGQMHYEGSLFTERVPVTSFDAYTLEQRRPDAIFIHNAYDGNNYVTTVHPNYYSDKLKKHTELLVYAPYFVSDGIDPNFMALASLRNIDRVIVQKEQYAREYQKFCPARKLLPLGSPKFDRAIMLRENPPEIPENWTKIIRGRKVVFYNTSLGTMLKIGDSYLKKLRFVFESFERQDEFVLLWRPHPLSEATIRSMRPQQLSEYRALTENYRKKQFGIYDDTPDPHIAIAIADVYYGDYSSLIYLFGITGKPVIMQDFYALDHSAAALRNSPNMSQMIPDENDPEKAWFVDSFTGKLCCANLETGECGIVAKFPHTHLCSRGGPQHIFGGMMNGKLYFVSAFLCELFEFDPGTGAFRIIALEKKYCFDQYDKNVYRQFHDQIWRHRDSMYFCPIWYRAIVELNTTTGKVSYHTGWKESAPVPDGHLLARSGRCGDTIWIISSGRDWLLAFDMDTKESRWAAPLGKGQEVDAVASDGSALWLATAPDSEGCIAVVRWNPETGETEAYKEFPDGFAAGRLAFANLYCAGGYVYCFPWDANMLVRLDTSDGVIRRVESVPVPERSGYKGQQFVTPWEQGRRLHTFSALARECIRFDGETGEAERVPLSFSPDAIRVRMDGAFQKWTHAFPHPQPGRATMREQHLPLSLMEFLQELMRAGCVLPGQREEFESLTANPDGTSGQKILEAVMKEIGEG